MSPRDELNGLLTEAIEMALRLSEENGEHFPFCMSITASGERLNMAADDREVAGFDVMFELVKNQVKDSIAQGQLRAVSVARHITLRGGPVPPGTSAVQITLDHISDNASTCYLPFTYTNGVIQPLELFATESVDKYFVESSPSPPVQQTKPGFMSRLFKNDA